MPFVYIQSDCFECFTLSTLILCGITVLEVLSLFQLLFNFDSDLSHCCMLSRFACIFFHITVTVVTCICRLCSEIIKTIFATFFILFGIGSGAKCIYKKLTKLLSIRSFGRCSSLRGQIHFMISYY